MVKTRRRKDLDEEGTLFDRIPDDTPPPRRRITYWTKPELDEVIASLEDDQQRPWDELIPGVLNAAAYYLPPEDLPKLCDWFLERLRLLRTALE